MDLNVMANAGLTHLVLSELHTCESYFNRLFYALAKCDEGSDKSHTLTSWCRGFIFTQTHLLQKSWLSENVHDLLGKQGGADLKEAQEFIRYLFKSLEGLIFLEIIPNAKRPALYAKTLNNLFQGAHDLHLIVNKLSKGNILVDQPRVMIMEKYIGHKEDALELYTIHSSSLEEIDQNKETPLQSLQVQREKKHEEYVHNAHDAIAKKDYKAAKEILKRALNFKETAMAFNLLSLCNALEGDTQTAKSLCLKAIKTDPGHGAAYNDLGSYLLAEGKFDESLKWFDLAKNARHYQNREFAYINAGRVFMEKREFKKALKEFSLALTLAPENETLHQTVIELKERLNRSEIKTDDSAPPPLF